MTRGARSLRIGVDFHVIDGKYQGSRSHLLGLFAEVVRLNPDQRFYFFLQDVAALSRIEAFRRDNVTLVAMPHANPVARLLWQLPRLRARHRLDLLHSQYVIPLWPARGNALTVHDILFERYPQYFTRGFVLRSRLLIPWSARRADLLFTVSEYSRQELARLYGIDPERIVVLHNAVDAARFYPGADGAEILARRGLTTQGFILSVGRIEPRKNYPLLLRAYAGMSGAVPPLVIVGQRDFRYGEFESAAAALPPSRPILILSDVRDEELPALYRHALAFAYPSLGEGFGMPPLEALASGTPVVTSATTAIPEIVGNAGLMIDPSSEPALRAALERLCGDAALRRSLIAAGLERARLFSWRRAAERVGAAYRGFAA